MICPVEIAGDLSAIAGDGCLVEGIERAFALGQECHGRAPKHYVLVNRRRVAVIAPGSMCSFCVAQSNALLIPAPEQAARRFPDWKARYPCR
jgi:hypothetical protein